MLNRQIAFGLILTVILITSAFGFTLIVPDVHTDPDTNELVFLFPEPDVEAAFNRQLNENVAGRVEDTDTLKIDLSGLSINLGEDRMTLTGNWRAQGRTKTRNPAHDPIGVGAGVGPEFIYGPWISLSGNFRAEIKAILDNWTIRAWTRVGDVQFDITSPNVQGVISGVSVAFLGTGGVSGSGTLFTMTFTAKAEGESILELQNLNLGAASGNPIPYQTIPGRVTVVQPEPEFLPEDINEDGVVNIFDLIAVAQSFGLPVPTNPRADVNADGTVNIFDLIAVAQNFGKSTTPLAPVAWQPLTMQHATMLEGWIRDAQGKNDGSGEFQHGIAVLEHLLNSIIPDEMQVFANFPNPFNPETWIPYQLSQASDVTVTIYDVNGKIIRRLELGFTPAGIYRTKSRSIYWDGRSKTGELVSSGVYFYHLLAGDFSATRKMVILK
jgi:hypothetical protein